MLKQKSKEWLKRYLPAEIIGTITAIGAASIFRLFYNDPIFIAYAGSLGEAIGFYSVIFIQNIISTRKKTELENKKRSFADLLKIITQMFLEFGPAGIIDGLLLRPFFMYLFPILLKNFMLGILVGKSIGDLTFYFLVILSYETKKRYAKHESH